jgi:hypothetical protein
MWAVSFGERERRLGRQRCSQVTNRWPMVVINSLQPAYCRRVRSMLSLIGKVVCPLFAETPCTENWIWRATRPNPTVDRTRRFMASTCRASARRGGYLDRYAARMRLRLGVFVLLFMPLLVCSQETRTEAMFTQWKGSNRLAVDLFAGHLHAQSLSEVIELHQLLRSASSWQQCSAEPFAVPPREQWAEVVSALRLVKELVTRGILGRFEVHSAYRNAELNECAGGAAGSAHLHTFAVDLVPLEGIDPAPLLCRFWSEHGRSWNMGLSRYPSGRIHIDTSGYRTWGADHTGKYAYCTSAAEPLAQADLGSQRSAAPGRFAHRPSAAKRRLPLRAALLEGQAAHD